MLSEDKYFAKVIHVCERALHRKRGAGAMLCAGEKGAEGAL